MDRWKDCKVVFREKALDEILFWLENSIAKDDDFHNNIGKQNTYELFFNIKEALNNPQINIGYVEFIQLNFMFEEDLKLPIPVYSYIRPTLQHQFILHLLLSFGRFETELDLVRHPTLRDSFRYAKLIGDNDDEESLKKYSDDIFVRFVEEQLIYFPNSRQQIDEWIQITGDLLDDVLITGCIPIT